MSCPKKDHCPMFPVFNFKPLLQFWLKKYCDHPENYKDCARNTGGDKPIADTLLPNGEDLEELRLKTNQSS
jgi:hypothetical protein